MLIILKMDLCMLLYKYVRYKCLLLLIFLNRVVVNRKCNYFFLEIN